MQNWYVGHSLHGRPKTMTTVYELSLKEEELIKPDSFMKKKRTGWPWVLPYMILASTVYGTIDVAHSISLERGKSPNLCWGSAGPLPSIKDYIRFWSKFFLHSHATSGDLKEIFGEE